MYSSPRALALKLLLEPSRSAPEPVPKVRIMLHKQPAVEGMWQGCTGYKYAVTSAEEYLELLFSAHLVGRIYLDGIYKGYFLRLESRNLNPGVFWYDSDTGIRCDTGQLSYSPVNVINPSGTSYSESTYSNAAFKRDGTKHYITADWRYRTYMRDRYGEISDFYTNFKRAKCLKISGISQDYVITADTVPGSISYGYYFGDGLTLEDYLTAQKAFAAGEAILGVEPDSMTT